MQTEIKQIEIRVFSHRSKPGYFDDSIRKEFEAVVIDEQYSLYINYLGYEKKQEIKKIFETLFVKKKPNLIEMKLIDMKLFSNSFRLFTDKRWEKLNYIYFCKC